MNVKDFFLSLSRLLDLAHPSLANHQLKTAYISWQLGELLNLNKDDLNDLIIAALIHDIGAITLEEKISVRNSSLDDFGTNHHERKGWFIVNNNLKTRKIANAIKYHHRKYSDLKEKYFLAQIIHLADTVERMIDREKEIFMQKMYIKESILKGSGTDFHPKIVDAYTLLHKKEGFWFTLENPNIRTIFSKAPIKKDTVNNIYHYSKLVRDILDFRSPYTVKHSTGVMICAKVIGEVLEFDNDKLKKITLAALLHDIGKLVVPNSILLKNGSLTNKEVYTMKKHAYYTYVFLTEAKFDRDICAWASYHHETPDGNGYPFCLTSEQIPFESRIIAFADIFVALTEDRPYREGLSKEKVESIMRSLIKINSEHKILDVIFDNYQNIFNLIRDEYNHIGDEYKKLLLL